VVPEKEFMGVNLNALEKVKSDAFVGYMAIDLYDPPPEATWGKFNDRIINKGWVTRLSMDFQRRYYNCIEDDSIEVAIRPSWLKNQDRILRRINGLRIGEVPVMEFTDEGKAAISPKNLIMLGGNHRRQAVRQHVEKLRADLEIHEKQIKDKGKDIPIAESNADEEMLEIEKEDAKWACYWSVRIYDRGE
jgi:hypothetical protein